MSKRGECRLDAELVAILSFETPAEELRRLRAELRAAKRKLKVAEDMLKSGQTYLVRPDR